MSLLDFQAIAVRRSIWNRSEIPKSRARRSSASALMRRYLALTG